MKPSTVIVENVVTRLFMGHSV